MTDEIYINDDETLKSLGFRFQVKVGNRLTYFIDTNGIQVYVYITYGIDNNKNRLYRAQITKSYITEAVIKPADTLDELINNIIKGNTQDYWWANDADAAKW